MATFGRGLVIRFHVNRTKTASASNAMANACNGEFAGQGTIGLLPSAPQMGDFMLRDEELSRVDNLVEKLNSAPRPDHMALSQQTRAQRDLAFQRMLDEGLSWGGSGEAMGAHPILNQPEANFWMELQSIDNNLGAQLGIIEHYMPKWFSMGEFPPPYYGMRVAIILRKSKEHDPS